MCYLWGFGLNVSRTPGAVQAPSSVGGGPAGGRRASGPALRVPAPPRPAGRRCRPPAASVGGRQGLVGGRGRRDARRTPRPARPGAPPARTGAPGDGRRRGTPAPPIPAGRGGAPLPRGQQQPFAAAGGQGQEGGGDRGGGGGGMRYGWPAARPGIRPAAGRVPGIACSFSIAIESVQPGFRSDSLHNMQNRQEYAK